MPRKSGRTVVFQTRLALAVELSRECVGSMLDCATGTGEISEAIYAAGQFYEATFVDISREMLRRARSRFHPSLARNVHFVQANIFRYLSSPEGSAKFDLIVCLGLVAHTGQLENLLRSLGDHVSDGGRILLQTSLQDHWGNYLWHLFLKRRAARHHGYALSCYSLKQINDAAENAQLSVLSIRRYGVGVPFVEKFLPRINHLFEVRFKNWAARYGAEAICTLGKK